MLRTYIWLKIGGLLIKYVDTKMGTLNIPPVLRIVESKPPPRVLRAVEYNGLTSPLLIPVLRTVGDNGPTPPPPHMFD